MPTRIRLCLILSMTAAILGARPSLAETGPADAEEMGRLFDVLCLRAFPDDSAVSREIAKLAPVSMTPDEVRLFLHDDPGRGWYLRTPLTHYAVTIEQPPYHACAVRRMTQAGFADNAAYARAVADFLARRRATAIDLPVRRSKAPDGADITLTAKAVPAPGGQSATDLLMDVVTEYHGRFRGVLQEDMAGGPGVEIRYVHQMPTAR